MRRAIQICKSTLFSALFALALVAPLAVAAAPQAAAVGVCSTTGKSVAEGNTDCLNKPPKANCTQLTSCDIISKYVDPLIKTLTALVGVAVVISIIIGGIQYSSSEGDPGKASAAKNRIRNSIIALITFILLSAMLNFLIPGGLL